MPNRSCRRLRLSRPALVSGIVVSLVACQAPGNSAGRDGNAIAASTGPTAAAQQALAHKRTAEIAFIEELLRERAGDGRRAPVGDVEAERMRELAAMSTPALEAELQRLRRAAAADAGLEESSGAGSTF